MSQTWSRSSGRENRGLALRNETHERRAADVERTDGDAVVGVAVVLCVVRQLVDVLTVDGLSGSLIARIISPAHKPRDALAILRKLSHKVCSPLD